MYITWHTPNNINSASPPPRCEVVHSPLPQAYPQWTVPFGPSSLFWPTPSTHATSLRSRECCCTPTCPASSSRYELDTLGTRQGGKKRKRVGEGRVGEGRIGEEKDREDVEEDGEEGKEEGGKGRRGWGGKERIRMGRESKRRMNRGRRESTRIESRTEKENDKEEKCGWFLVPNQCWNTCTVTLYMTEIYTLCKITHTFCNSQITNDHGGTLQSCEHATGLHSMQFSLLMK